MSGDIYKLLTAGRVCSTSCSGIKGMLTMLTMLTSGFWGI